MGYRTELPKISRFVFGTSNTNDRTNPEHLKVVRMAMDAGVWFHTSTEYGKDGAVLAILKEAFQEKPSNVPPVIAKVVSSSAEVFRATVEKILTELGIERIDMAQVLSGPAAAKFAPDQPMYETMCALQQEGKVGCYTYEIFWRFSPNALDVVEQDLFDSYIFYYNVTNREMTNELYDRLMRSKRPLLSLRTMGGGPYSYRGTPHPEAARVAMEELFEQSGCADRVTFRYRFPLSVPGVVTTIGGPTKCDHLQAILDADRNFEPLPPQIVARIQELHRAWFADAGMEERR